MTGLNATHSHDRTWCEVRSAVPLWVPVLSNTTRPSLFILQNIEFSKLASRLKRSQSPFGPFLRTGVPTYS